MHGFMDQLFKDMFRIKMMLSVGLFLAVALVNTQGLSIQGEEGVAIHGDEVEQELDVSRVFLFLYFNKNGDLRYFNPGPPRCWRACWV